MTLDEFVEKTNAIITEIKPLGRKIYYDISADITDTDIVERLTSYYRRLGYGIEVRPCRFGKFDVSIWWD